MAEAANPFATPTSMLRRATSVLNSKGQLAHALHDTDADEAGPSSPVSLSPPSSPSRLERRSSSSVSTSIKKLSGRLRSLSRTGEAVGVDATGAGRLSAPSEPRGRHIRAKSETLTTRPSLLPRNDAGYISFGSVIEDIDIDIAVPSAPSSPALSASTSQSTTASSPRPELARVPTLSLSFKSRVAGGFRSLSRGRPPADAPGDTPRLARARSDVRAARPAFAFSSEPDFHEAHVSADAPAPLPHGRTVSAPLLPIATATPPPIASPAVRAKMDVKVPQLLREGMQMMKVSAKRQRRVVCRLDPERGQITYETKRHRVVPIEAIKEIRTGADARYYREQFQLSADYEDRWLTLVYLLNGAYKTLHLIAPTRTLFQMWETTLRRLYALRQELMCGLGNLEVREAVWARQYWANSDEQADQRLSFEEVEKMCKRLNINSPSDQLRRLFKQADVEQREYLDFNDFRRFVKLLKARPELDRLYLRLQGSGAFDFAVFEKFMRESQKSELSPEHLEQLFRRHATDVSTIQVSPSLPSDTPPSAATPIPPLTVAPAPSAPTNNAPSSTPTELHDPTPTDGSDPEADADAVRNQGVPLASLVLTRDNFTAFLLSPDNSAFADQHEGVWHDMTRPLPEYFISTSHNTYLVGHQLMGESTVEGYIRALLHSCRSVELDIYDGELEPVVYHGKTLTSRVPVREVCTAIAKYAFATSPYPIIISAEIHCGLVQQDMLARIMQEAFGDTLVSAPVDGRPKIEVLPSPEALRGRVLLKAKNLYVSASEGPREKDLSYDAESSSTPTGESSAEEMEIFKEEVKGELKEVKHELKHELQKARNIVSRVRHGQTPSGRVILGGHGSSASSSEVAVSTNAGPTEPVKSKVKMSLDILTLLVYTVGVKCRGINKKEEYAPEHVFSLSETTANKILKQGMMDLIKHNRTHLVRIYPKGLRVNSTNYEPHRYWSAGAQLVALNWQTFDLGYMINHAMFQRNGRAGYVLKPKALREPSKDLLCRRTKHLLEVTIISAQQLPRRKDKTGHEILDKSIMDPLVEVSIHVPDWTHSPFLPTSGPAAGADYSPATGTSGGNATTARTVSFRTGPVKNNGFNPVWEESFLLPFDCVGDMKDLVFVRFAVKEEEDREDVEPIALYCASLGSLQQGFRHLPLHDAQLSQYLFSTLFVQISIRDA